MLQSPSMTFIKRTVTALIALAAAGTSVSAIAAGVIVDSGGFEGYALGALEGQQGWVIAGPGSTATVQTGITQAGTRAVAVQKSANVDRRWAIPVAGYPTGRYVVVDWSMRVTPTGAAAGVFGPFFGVEGYDANAGIGLLGSLGVDATTGDVMYQTQDDGVLTETTIKATFNSWHHFRMLLDFAQDQYSVYFDGAKLATTGFVDRSQGLNDFTDADIATFAAGFDAPSQAQPGTAYFDNFRVWESLAADFNFDGTVNDADLAFWENHLGAMSSADADADGDADGADFLVWQRSFGADVFASSPAITAVPEPSGLLLVAASAAMLACFKRR